MDLNDTKRAGRAMATVAATSAFMLALSGPVVAVEVPAQAIMADVVSTQVASPETDSEAGDVYTIDVTDEVHTDSVDTAEAQTPATVDAEAAASAVELASADPAPGFDTFKVAAPDQFAARASRQNTWEDKPTSESYDVVAGVGRPSLENAFEGTFGSEMATTVAVSGRPDLLIEEVVRADEGASVEVETIDASAAIPGSAFALSVTLDDGEADAAWVDLALDLTGVSNLYGANYGDRLQLLAFPACALTDPDNADCLIGVELPRSDDLGGLTRVTAPADSGHVLEIDGAQFGMSRGAAITSATRSSDLLAGLAHSQGVTMEASVAGPTIVVAVAGAASQAGDFAASTLPSAGTWAVGEQSGAFSYSIGVDVPPVTGGPTPDLSLNYSSSAVDGQNLATNNQSGLVGDGWSLSTAYIERNFKNCEDDIDDGADRNFEAADYDGDLCWQSPYSDAPASMSLTLVLDGSAYDVVRDSGNLFYVEDNPDWRLTRVTRSGDSFNGDNNSEYFVLRTPDGSVYYFGLGDVDGMTTNSVATVPVYGDDDEEPHGDSGTDPTVQGYRFMLDHEEDSTGFGATYEYAQSTNHYRSGSGSTLEYVRDIRLLNVFYGARFDEADADAPGSRLSSYQAKANLGYSMRCVETTTYNDPLSAAAEDDCAQSALKAVTDPDGLDSDGKTSTYVDTPIDLLCTGSCTSVQDAPVFFATHRLDNITTLVYASGDWGKVQRTQLVQSMPATSDQNTRALWLDSVYTVAYNDYDTDDYLRTYAVTFDGTEMNNRVDWDPSDPTRTALPKRRITRVTEGTGERIRVDYADYGEVDVCPTEGFDLDDEDDSQWVTDFVASKNTDSCYTSVRKKSAGIYHHYLVKEIKLVDTVGGQPEQTYTYAYIGNGAWNYAENELYDNDDSHSGFSDWRGYEVVRVTTGTGDNALTVRNQYFRGISKRYMASSGEEGPVVDLETIVGGFIREDVPRMAGYLASSTTRDAEGTLIAATAYQYSLTQPSTGNALQQASIARLRTTVDYAYEPGTTWSSTSTTTSTYNDNGYLDHEKTTVATTNDGSEVDSATTCVEYGYAQNTTNADGAAVSYWNEATWHATEYLMLQASTTTYEGTCASGTETSYSYVLYDGSETLSDNTPTRGLATAEVQKIDGDTYSRAEATYDDEARIITATMPEEVKKAQGNSSYEPAMTTWTYWRNAAGVTKTAVTDAAGNTSATWAEPNYGNVYRQKSANGDFTYYGYDAFGMLTQVWAPTEYGQSSAPSLDVVPTAYYEYDLYTTELSARTRPVAVMSASYMGKNASGNYICIEDGCFVNRSYTFYDGFGREIQTHTVAADGSEGRTVSATQYDQYGQVILTSGAFYDSKSAQFSSGLVDLVADDYETDVDTYTEIVYDALGRTISSTSMVKEADELTAVAQQEVTTTYLGSKQATQTLAYDDDGANPEVVATTEATYDARNRLVTQTQLPADDDTTSTAITTNYAYETFASGSRTTVTDSGNKKTEYTWDLAGRQTSLKDPNAGLTSYTYDADGNATETTSPAGTVTMEYDVLGRLVGRTSKEPDGSDEDESSSATWTYANAENLADLELDTGDLGLLVKETATTVVGDDSYEVATTYTYDEDHRLAESTVTLPDSELLGDLSGYVYTQSFDYDDVGQLTDVDLPAAGSLEAETVTTGYNRFGQAVTLSTLSAGNAEQLVTGVTYDAIGRLTSRSYVNGGTRTVSWNADSSIAQVAFGAADGTDPVQDDEYVYDDAGRVTAIIDQVVRSDETDTYDYIQGQCFVYDGLNRLQSAWTYDATGTTEGETAECGTAVDTDDTSWTYDASSYAQSWTYDKVGEILTQSTTLPSTSTLDDGDTLDATEQLATASADPVASAEATTSAQPSTSASASTAATATPSTTVDPTASAEDTETEETAPAASAASVDEGAVGAASTVNENFDSEDSAHPAAVTKVTATSSEGETTKSYQYDAAGRLTTRTANGETLTASWDVMSNLVSTTNNSGTQLYLYDASGQRVARISDTAVTAYFGATEVTDTAVNTAGDGVTATRYYTLGSTTIGYLTDEGELWWLLADVQGSATVAVEGDEPIADANVQRVAYTPYGQVRGTSELTDTDRGWLGQVEDSSTELSYLNARYYDATIGRFLSPDPLLDASDPRSLDAYMYANNNPVEYADPTGLDPKLWDDGRAVGVPGSGSVQSSSSGSSTSTAPSAGNTQSNSSGSVFEGDDLVSLFVNLAKEGNDTAYLDLYNSLTKEIRDGISPEGLYLIDTEAQNRLLHQQVCEANPGECWAPCPSDSYTSCQLERGAVGVVVYVVVPALVGFGGSYLARAAATDMAAASSNAVRVESYTYVDMTLGRSIRNVGTNATYTEVAETLSRTGWSSWSAKNGTVQIFEKDGAKFVLREPNSSGYPGWTLDYTPQGAAEKVIEIRLGYEQ
ncbi:RHS repeat-associated core domain-containing protein [Demequina sp. NBRC 110054]|uniref:RHS repeat-associated core domain-containing protein n=1 Tax=Demequina sp. NBRC 110054 TaxID=1570343 RepID=UPI000A04BF84|nr:RHS repeat-associated core domain-containing protein [Demequina sp. NBRC 110054]